MTPLCTCHGEPMDRKSPSSHGRWECSVQRRARHRRYLLTDKGRARIRRFRLTEATGRRQARINHYKEMTQ